MWDQWSGSYLVVKSTSTPRPFASTGGTAERIGSGVLGQTEAPFRAVVIGYAVVHGGAAAGDGDDLEFAIALADIADDVALRHFTSEDLHVVRKIDGSPVTAAHVDVESRLRSAVGEEFPSDVFPWGGGRRVRCGRHGAGSSMGSTARGCSSTGSLTWGTLVALEIDGRMSSWAWHQVLRSAGVGGRAAAVAPSRRAPMAMSPSRCRVSATSDHRRGRRADPCRDSMDAQATIGLPPGAWSTLVSSSIGTGTTPYVSPKATWTWSAHFSGGPMGPRRPGRDRRGSWRLL